MIELSPIFSMAEEVYTERLDYGEISSVRDS